MIDDEDEEVVRESEECGRWSVVLGFGGGGGATNRGGGGGETAFVYDEVALKEAMFGGADADADEGRRKRRKLSGGEEEKKGLQRTVVLENEDEK